MNMRPFALCLAAVLALSIQAQESLKLNVPEYHPYTYTEGKVAKGLGVDRVQELCQAAKVSITVTGVANYGKAVKNVSDHESDGFFLASRNSERDSICVFVGPLIVSKWTWFLRADSTLDPNSKDFSHQAKVGTVLNSNQHTWLTAKQYQVGLTPAQPELLPVILVEKKMVDAVLAADLVFYQALEKAKMPKESIKAVVQEEKPMGLYISKDWAAKNPAAMERLQAAVKTLKP